MGPLGGRLASPGGWSDVNPLWRASGQFGPFGWKVAPNLGKPALPEVGGAHYVPLTQIKRQRRIMASKNVHVFNDLNFDQEVLGGAGKILVDFTATWCGPCKRLSPIVEEVADELEGKVKVGKLDIDEAPMTAAKFQVRGVPTLMVFEGGQQVGQIVGLVSKAKVKSLVGE